MNTEVTPDRILQVGLGFWGPKVLLSAVELGIFTELAQGPADLATLTKQFSLRSRSARDFLDALIALGMLARDGDHYANTPETDFFLDRAKPSYVGGLLLCRPWPTRMFRTVLFFVLVVVLVVGIIGVST